MRRSLCLLAALLATGTPASAQIYRWTDAEGRLHFTERLDRVPAEHRQAAVRGAEKGPTGSVQTFSPPDAEASAARASGRSRTVDGAVSIPFVRDGSLMRVEAVLNDVVTAPFLVDTGASGVSLPTEVADRLGIRVRPDTPHVQVMTANGVMSRALVKLDSVQVGGARVEGLEATVNPSMPIGLLGGSFFNNFVYQVDATSSVITLEPHDQLRGGLDSVAWQQRFRSLQDPLAQIDAHLASGQVKRPGEREILEQRRAELQKALEELQLEANRLDVPHAWRR